MVIVAGEAVYAVANIIWYPYVVGFDVTLPIPSIADYIYIPAYTTVLARHRHADVEKRAQDRASVIDAAMTRRGVGSTETAQAEPVSTR